MTTTPAPSGPYRTVVHAGTFAFCSGQIGVRDGLLVDGGLEAELRQAVANLLAALFAEGLTVADVRKTTVYLTDMAGFEAMNAVYAELFPDPRPARTTVGVVALPRGACVEIEAIALGRTSGFTGGDAGLSAAL